MFWNPEVLTAWTWHWAFLLWENIRKWGVLWSRTETGQPSRAGEEEWFPYAALDQQLNHWHWLCLPALSVGSMSNLPLQQGKGWGSRLLHPLSIWGSAWWQCLGQLGDVRSSICHCSEDVARLVCVLAAAGVMGIMVFPTDAVGTQPSPPRRWEITQWYSGTARLNDSSNAGFRLKPSPPC